MTESKIFQISDNAGVNWHTLPGGSGEWNDESDQIEDTIFGQTFSSTQPGLITWTANANALYKGFAGYVARLMSSGTSTQMTAEAMSSVAGVARTYEITNPVRRIIDHSKSVSVLDSGTPVSASNIERIDYLFGRVTFVSGYTVTGPVTITAWYLPMTEIAKGNSFNLTQTVDPLDKTDFPTARANNGYRVFEPGLRTVNLEIGGFYEASSAFWEILESREQFVIEINPDGSGLSLARGVFKLVTRGQSGDVGALEEETRNFALAVPENVPIVFNWRHDPATTLSTAVRIMLDSFIDRTMPMIRYGPDGNETGSVVFQGTAVATDVSLSSSLDAMNEFTANFQGSGAPTRPTLT